MIVALLLQAVLFAHPTVSAYAGQIKGDVVVSVTFADVQPTRVCTYLYDVEDDAMRDARDAHCWTPTTAIGSLDVWPNLRLDDGNFKVVISSPDRPDQSIYLVMRVNT